MIIAIVLRTTGAFAIWYALTYGLSGEQKDPVSHGRKVAAWVASSAVVATPSMHRNGPDLAVFILINVFIWGGIAFVVGYLWRKFRPVKELIASESPVNSVHEPTAISVTKLAATASASIGETIPPLDSTMIDEDAIYIAIANELETGSIDKAIWTRAFAEADGDESRAKAAYIKRRAERLLTANERARLAEIERQSAAEVEAGRLARIHSLRAEAEVKAARVARVRSFFSSPEAKSERVILKSPAERRREVGSLWLFLLLWLVVFGGGFLMLQSSICSLRLGDTIFCNVLMSIMVMCCTFSVFIAFMAVYETIKKLPAFFNRESDFNLQKISFTFTFVFLSSLALLGYVLIDFPQEFVIKDFVKWLLIRYAGTVFPDHLLNTEGN